MWKRIITRVRGVPSRSGWAQTTATRAAMGAQLREWARVLFVGSPLGWPSISSASLRNGKCAPSTARPRWNRGRQVVTAMVPSSSSKSGAGGIEEPRLRPVGADGCSTGEVERLARSVAGWLDGEYPEDTLREAHRVVGDTAAAHYAAVRGEGTDEVGAVLLALGARLESDMGLFRELFVGPWEVANKMSELVLHLPVAVPPAHSDDAFARYNFLQRMLDREVEDAQVNGAVAITAGFLPVAGTGVWSAAEVRDSHFAALGKPADVLAGGGAGGDEWCDTLKYMHSQLGIEDESKREEFHTFIEALHGMEISRIRRNEDSESAAKWRKLEAVAMWLHLMGDY